MRTIKSSVHYGTTNQAYIGRNINCVLATFFIVEPRFDEGPMDWPNKTRFRYIEVLFHLFSCNWGREYRSLYGELCHVEVRYFEVPLY